MTAHLTDLAGKLSVGGATVWATVSAITSDTVGAWCAVVIGAIFYALAELRKAHRQRKQDDLDIEARRAIHRANMDAIKKHEPPPYPQFLPRADAPA